ncbi:MarR family winged helix-turn-helix transcriptional regulator [Shewanella dokdonensis]|uniref:MarR family transcriptional regulator n=1 Tax=Shewanella dokdonensis TaxID=712036 RepID=A0ABX8DBR3_9GAMM|nr:MarR family transcriptional regulator [Shewanella dokdonensis]MCL1075422.1 MarR family transcriptional regulator [Shewanella dokdonensis]QVK22111.1 MarR family transcriptional regulator [Shewanella dokdonensis]
MTTFTTTRSRFGLHFSLIARQWRRVMQTQLTSIGLTDTTWVPLVHLNECPGLTLKALALRVGVDSSSLVRVIDALERDGVVERKRDIADGRSKQLFLTEKGEQRVACIRGELCRFEETMLIDINDDEIEVIKTLFDRLQLRLDAFENNNDPESSS